MPTISSTNISNSRGVNTNLSQCSGACSNMKLMNGRLNNVFNVFNLSKRKCEQSKAKMQIPIGFSEEDTKELHFRNDSFPIHADCFAHHDKKKTRSSSLSESLQFENTNDKIDFPEQKNTNSMAKVSGLTSAEEGPVENGFVYVTYPISHEMCEAFYTLMLSGNDMEVKNWKKNLVSHGISLFSFEDAELKLSLCVRDGRIQYRDSNVEFVGIKGPRLLKSDGFRINRKGQLIFHGRFQRRNVTKKALGIRRIPFDLDELIETLDSLKTPVRKESDEPAFFPKRMIFTCWKKRKNVPFLRKLYDLNTSKNHEKKSTLLDHLTPSETNAEFSIEDLGERVKLNHFPFIISKMKGKGYYITPFRIRTKNKPNDQHLLQIRDGNDHSSDLDMEKKIGKVTIEAFEGKISPKGSHQINRAKNDCEANALDMTFLPQIRSPSAIPRILHLDPAMLLARVKDGEVDFDIPLKKEGIEELSTVRKMQMVSLDGDLSLRCSLTFKNGKIVQNKSRLHISSRSGSILTSIAEFFSQKVIELFTPSTLERLSNRIQFLQYLLGVNIAGGPLNSDRLKNAWKVGNHYADLARSTFKANKIRLWPGPLSLGQIGNITLPENHEMTLVGDSSKASFQLEFDAVDSDVCIGNLDSKIERGKIRIEGDLARKDQHQVQFSLNASVDEANVHQFSLKDPDGQGFLLRDGSLNAMRLTSEMCFDVEDLDSFAASSSSVESNLTIDKISGRLEKSFLTFENPDSSKGEMTFSSESIEGSLCMKDNNIVNAMLDVTNLHASCENLPIESADQSSNDVQFLFNGKILTPVSPNPVTDSDLLSGLSFQGNMELSAAFA